MTTKPSLFWVDPNEFRALLQRAGSNGAARVDERIPIASTETGTVEVNTVQGEISGTRLDLGNGSTQLELSDGPLEFRLVALLAWIRSQVEFDHAFVVDQEGLALVHESAPLELIAASAEMSATWNSLRNRFDLATENLLSVDLKDGQHLDLVTTTTGWGTLSLGLVVRTLIPKTTIEAINAQFRRTLEDTKERDRS